MRFIWIKTKSRFNETIHKSSISEGFRGLSPISFLSRGNRSLSRCISSRRKSAKFFSWPWQLWLCFAKVVDLWGGLSSKETGAAWQHDTIANVFSCSKGVTNMVILWFLSPPKAHSSLSAFFSWPKEGYWDTMIWSGKCGRISHAMEKRPSQFRKFCRIRQVSPTSTRHWRLMKFVKCKLSDMVSFLPSQNFPTWEFADVSCLWNKWCFFCARFWARTKIHFSTCDAASCVADKGRATPWIPSAHCRSVCGRNSPQSRS